MFQEAIKFNYDHPPMWETCLLLSIDTGEFTLAIKAMHRLLDMKKKYKDDEVIEILAKQIAAFPQVQLYSFYLYIYIYICIFFIKLWQNFRMKKRRNA